MGNIITQNNDTLVTNKKDNNLLLLYIHNWALNNYKINDSNMYSKDVLKKRACCTGSGIIGLEFPTYKNPTEIMTTKVRFEVFKELPIPDECKLIIDDNNNVGSFYFRLKESNTEHCKRFYSTDDNNFCGYVLNNRSLNNKFTLSNVNNNPDILDEKIYGSLINKNINIDKKIDNNAYTDCNCLNSPAVLYDFEKKYKNNDGNPLSNQQIAQNMDNLCKTAIINNKVYIDSNQISDKICINNSIIGNIAISEGATNNNFKVQQSCNQSSNTSTNTNANANTDTKSSSVIEATNKPIQPSTVIQENIPKKSDNRIEPTEVKNETGYINRRTLIISITCIFIIIILIYNI